MLQRLQEVLSHTWSLLMERAADFVPKLLAGIFILIVGIVIARLVRGVAARFFLAVRLDRVSDRLGVSAFLARGDIRYTMVEILATAIYWLVLLFSFEILGITLGLEGMAAFFGQILAYVPRIFVALVVVLVGIAVGYFFGGAVQVAASNAGFPAARALGATIKSLVGFFAFVMALEQLEIATAILVVSMQIVIGAVAFSLALAFGLGCKDLAGQTVQGWLTRAQNRESDEQ
jgi:hypothetical protein